MTSAVAVGEGRPTSAFKRAFGGTEDFGQSHGLRWGRGLVGAVTAPHRAVCLGAAVFAAGQGVIAEGSAAH